ncbi:MAG: hypothetical protein Q7J21_09955 [Rugosibacter sp.]|nr:hypothetical protein [Rugosibacter sp.]
MRVNQWRIHGENLSSAVCPDIVFKIKSAEEVVWQTLFYWRSGMRAMLADFLLHELAKGSGSGLENKINKKINTGNFSNDRNGF